MALGNLRKYIVFLFDCHEAYGNTQTCGQFLVSNGRYFKISPPDCEEEADNILNTHFLLSNSQTSHTKTLPSQILLTVYL